MERFKRPGYVATLLATLSALNLAEKKQQERHTSAEFQSWIKIALELAQSSPLNHKLPRKPIKGEWLERLNGMGIKLVEALTVKEIFHLLGLTQAATARQVEILKHFKVPGATKMNKTLANHTIRRLFADAEHIAAWRQRPPTSRAMQGLLYMNGRFTRGMTQHQAQRKLKASGIEDPTRYQEWKRIETLFTEVNDQVSLKRKAIRKITWKKFFYYYDEFKQIGVPIEEISVEMMLTRIATHQRGKKTTTQPVASAA